MYVNTYKYIFCLSNFIVLILIGCGLVFIWPPSVLKNKHVLCRYWTSIDCNLLLCLYFNYLNIKEKYAYVCILLYCPFFDSRKQQPAFWSAWCNGDTKKWIDERWMGTVSGKSIRKKFAEFGTSHMSTANDEPSECPKRMLQM